MKPEFQAKFLQHLNKRRQQDEGFTLIELLVVIIIIGILAAIALPSLLAQVNKAKQAEAKQNVGAMNRAQQAYFLENQCFVTATLSQLGVGIKTETVNYTYLITPTPGSDPTCTVQANNMGVAKGPTLKSYLGLNTTLTGDPTTSELLSLGFVCETLNPATTLQTSTAGVTSCDSTIYKDLGGK